MVNTQLILGSMAPLVRDSHSTVSRLPGIASPDTSELYYGSHCYRPQDYIINIAASQYFLIFSINIKVTTSGATAGSALATAARPTPGKFCLFPGFFITLN